ncbi:MAG TPA: hypothetical protein VKT72_11765 [Candidatus Baltobacteraceae bacterium]|nr:hypothetical protein [Candidatus Baltobacteraceae bacterium]
MLAFVLAAITAATPAPKPTPQLKVIVNVRSSSLCTSVRDTAVPITYVTQRDDQAFGAINHSMIKFMQEMPDVSPTDQAQLKSMENSLDDTALYKPNAELSVERVNRIAYEVMQNLTMEDQVMNASWKQYPKGQFDNVDALRQRLQNLMDLQRALADRYMQFVDTYFGNKGQAQSSQNPTQGMEFLRYYILGQSAALAAVNKEAGDPEAAAVANAHDIAQYGNVAQIAGELRLQEMAYGNEIRTAAKTCAL